MLKYFLIVGIISFFNSNLFSQESDYSRNSFYTNGTFDIYMEPVSLSLFNVNENPNFSVDIPFILEYQISNDFSLNLTVNPKYSNRIDSLFPANHLLMNALGLNFRRSKFNQYNFNVFAAPTFSTGYSLTPISESFGFMFKIDYRTMIYKDILGLYFGSNIYHDFEFEETVGALQVGFTIAQKFNFNVELTSFIVDNDIPEREMLRLFAQ